VVVVLGGDYVARAIDVAPLWGSTAATYDRPLERRERFELGVGAYVVRPRWNVAAASYDRPLERRE